MLWLRWEVITPISDIYTLDKTAWCTTQDKYRFLVSFIFLLTSFILIVILSHVLNILPSSNGVFSIPTTT